MVTIRENGQDARGFCHNAQPGRDCSNAGQVTITQQAFSTVSFNSEPHSDDAKLEI
jgi:hypothetical protein